MISVYLQISRKYLFRCFVVLSIFLVRNKFSHIFHSEHTRLSWLYISRPSWIWQYEWMARNQNAEIVECRSFLEASSELSLWNIQFRNINSAVRLSGQTYFREASTRQNRWIFRDSLVFTFSQLLVFGAIWDGCYPPTAGNKPSMIQRRNSRLFHKSLEFLSHFLARAYTPKRTFPHLRPKLKGFPKQRN